MIDKCSSAALALALASALVVALPLTASAGSFLVTGQNGTTLDGTWTCQKLDGHWLCDSQSVVTTPEGLTGSRNRTTSVQPGGLTSTLSGTRVSGRSFGRSVTVSR